MNIKLELPNVTDLRPRLTVIGVGGAGGNAVNNMINSGLSGVSFVVANTDAQSLANSSADNRLQLGAALTEGLGAGARPEIGQKAAEEALDDIRAQVAGSHMVFIAAGMGGGTGTGAAAVIARVARESGALTVAVVTKPFQFEGSRRMRAAEAGIAMLKPNVDTMIVIPNQNLFRIANAKTTFAEAFVLADQVLYSGIACIVDLIVKEGLINLDFADVRTVMSGMGAAMMGTGEAGGENRAVAAAEEAISNPLLDDISLRGAKGLLLSITGGRDLTLYEVDEAASRVRQEVDPEANIIVGATFDDTLEDRIRVSIVASGMETTAARQPAGAAAPSWPNPAPSGSPASFQAGAIPPAVPQSRPGDTNVAGPTAAGGGRPRDDLTRALAEAFGSTVDHQPAHPDAAPQSRQPWSSASGAVFEEAPPQLSSLSTMSSPAQSNYEPPPVPDEPFQAQPPVEVRRAPRRLPEVEDFPAIGQREYRAKAEHLAEHHATQPAHAPPNAQPRPTSRPAAEPPRQRGFLERLTGARRRGAEPSAPLVNTVARDTAPMQKGRRPGVDADSPQRAPQINDAADTPGSFGRDRKSR